MSWNLKNLSLHTVKYLVFLFSGIGLVIGLFVCLEVSRHENRLWEDELESHREGLSRFTVSIRSLLVKNEPKLVSFLAGNYFRQNGAKSLRIFDAEGKLFFGLENHTLDELPTPSSVDTHFRDLLARNEDPAKHIIGYGGNLKPEMRTQRFESFSRIVLPIWSRSLQDPKFLG